MGEKVCWGGQTKEGRAGEAGEPKNCGVRVAGEGWGLLVMGLGGTKRRPAAVRGGGRPKKGVVSREMG